MLCAIHFQDCSKEIDKNIPLLGDPKKYSCFIKRKIHKETRIFKIKIVLNYQLTNLILIYWS